MTAFAKRHVDALVELMNMGAGHAGSACAEMLDVRSVLHPPKVDYWRSSAARAALERTLGTALPQVMMRFGGLVQGYSCLLFTPEMAKAASAQAMGDPDVDEDTMVSTLEEVGNVMLNAAMGTLSNLAGADLVYQVPRYYHRAVDNPMFTESEPMAFARTRLQIEANGRRLPGEMVLIVACQLPPVFLTALDMLLEEDPEQQFLLPGDLVTSDKPAIWSTVLGSCVSVCIRHRTRTVAGMNHYLLARADGRQDVGRYGDSSIQSMWQQLSRWDADPKHYTARVFGGARMFEAQAFEIGERNIDMAKRVLAEIGIPIIESKVGGRVGVHLRYATAENRVECRAHSA